MNEGTFSAPCRPGLRERIPNNIFAVCEALTYRDTIVPDHPDEEPEYTRPHHSRPRMEFAVNGGNGRAPRSALDFMKQARLSGLNVSIFTMRDEAVFLAADTEDDSQVGYREWITVNADCVFAALRM